MMTMRNQPSLKLAPVPLCLVHLLTSISIPDVVRIRKEAYMCKRWEGGILKCVKGTYRPGNLRNEQDEFS